MARPKRILYPGALYHVTSRGNDKGWIVHGDLDRRLFVKTLGETVELHGLRLHAWVLMDNHFHLLVETPLPNLPKAMQYLNGVYTQKFNFFHRRVGHLLQGRFKSILVDKNTYFLELCRYIALNPVRAGLVGSADEWKWGGYRSMAGLEDAPAWFDPTGVLALFPGRPREKKRAFRRFVAEGLQKGGSPLEQAKGFCLGGESFLAFAQELVSKEPPEKVPPSQKVLFQPDPRKVLDLVVDMFGVPKGSFEGAFPKERVARDVAFYLLREAGYDSTKIGEWMYSAPSTVRKGWGRVKALLRENGELARRIQKVSGNGLTPVLG